MGQTAVPPVTRLCVALFLAIAFGMAMLLGSSTQQAVAATPYAVQTLGTLPGHSTSHAYGINDAGQVVGVSAIDSDYNYSSRRAFLYENGAMKDLGALSYNDNPGEAFDINGAGEVVGYSFYWGSAQFGGAYSNHAVLYEPGGFESKDRPVMKELGGYDSEAYGINDSGQVVGVSSNDKAFLYENGTMKDLGALAGHSSSEAYDINDAGQVVGFSSNDGSYASRRAFLYENGAMKDLGALAGNPSSEAYGINASGQVVGMSFNAGSYASRRAFLYEDGVMKDLNSLLPAGSGWVLRRANAINTAGQIVGIGELNGEKRAFLLTPTPTPPPPPPDTMAPKVKKVLPGENTNGISPGANVNAFFSEAMRKGSINIETVKLYRAGTTTELPAKVRYDAERKKAILDPYQSLALGKKYKAVVTTGAKDLAGNRLDQDQDPWTGKQSKTWFFKVRN